MQPPNVNLLTLTVFVGVLACNAQPRPAASSSDPASLATRLDSVVPPLLSAHKILGVAVAIVGAEGLVVLRGYGRTAPEGGLIDSTSVFPVASLSKPVFAAIVATLVKEGHIALDTPLVSYGGLTSLPSDSRSATITARHILNHSSGLQFSPTGDHTLEHDPGSKWRYSGEAYRLLQRILEARAGRSLAGLAEAVFAANDMPNSTFGPLRKGVTPVRGFDGEGRHRSDGTYKTISAASTLRSTAADYARFVQRTMTSSVLRNAACSPEVEVDAALGVSWGRGWAVERLKGGAALAFHWGSNPGYKSFAAFGCSGLYGIVILTNGDQGLEIASSIVEAVDGINHPLFRFYMLHPND